MTDQLAEEGQRFGTEYIAFLKKQTMGEGGLFLEDRVLTPCLKRHWGDMSQGRGLDVGCGFGVNTQRMLRADQPPKQLDAVDISPEMLSFAKSYIDDPAVTFSSMSATSLQFGDGTFDFAASAFVWENMPNGIARKSFAEVARVLKNSGQFTLAMLHPTWLLMVSGRNLAPDRANMERRFAEYGRTHEVVIDRDKESDGVYTRQYRPLEMYLTDAADAGLVLRRTCALCIPDPAEVTDLPAKYHSKQGLPVFSVTTWVKP